MVGYKRRYTNSCSHWKVKENISPSWDGTILDNCGNCRWYNRADGRCEIHNPCGRFTKEMLSQS